MNDPCLSKFDEEWVNAVSLVEKAVVLYNHFSYIKKRYKSIDKLSGSLAPKLNYLEEHINESSGADFLKISRVISEGRRTIADAGSKYGSGFRKRPSARERAAIAKAFPGIRLIPDPDFIPETDPVNGSLHDFFAGDLGDDSV